MRREIKNIFVHCTATLQHATVEGLEYYFKKKLGWNACGYHKVIDAEGVVHTLEPDSKIANGVRGYNKESLHVSYIGGVKYVGKKIIGTDNRTDAQKEALEKVVKEWKEQHPDAIVLGHRDVSPDLNGNGIVDSHERIKECPCFDVFDWCKEVGIQTERFHKPKSE